MLRRGPTPGAKGSVPSTGGEFFSVWRRRRAPPSIGVYSLSSPNPFLVERMGQGKNHHSYIPSLRKGGESFYGALRTPQQGTSFTKKANDFGFCRRRIANKVIQVYSRRESETTMDIPGQTLSAKHPSAEIPSWRNSLGQTKLFAGFAGVPSRCLSVVWQR